MNADGSNPRRLTNNPGFDTGPQWSSDGRRILFSSLRQGNVDVYLMNVDGSDLTRLTTDPGQDVGPVFSREGPLRIDFSTDRAGTVPGDDLDIYIMNADGTSQRPLVTGGSLEFSASW